MTEVMKDIRFQRYKYHQSSFSVSSVSFQAQIAFLQGERRGQENLKKDLVRRIKMLEYALKQERSAHTHTHNDKQQSN